MADATLLPDPRLVLKEQPNALAFRLYVYLQFLRRAVLDRHHLVKRAGRIRNRVTGTLLSQGAAPNDLWCTDYKGEFRLGNRSWCYPLTVTDHALCFVLLCEALETTRE
jgi:hypothetical protein